MEDNKPTSRYKDSGCSFVVEVQPDYDKEETEGNKGSSDDVTAGVTDQQALVHREEIPDDRSSGNHSRDACNTPFLLLSSILSFLTQVSKIHDCLEAPIPVCHSQIFQYPVKVRPIRVTATAIKSSTTPATLVTLCTVVVTNPTMCCRGNWRDGRNGWNSTNRRI